MGQEHAKSIFLHAVEEVAPNDWSSYLDEVCGDNEPLRRDVERLLGAHRQDLDFAQEAREACQDVFHTVDQICAEPEGGQIGPYKLREQIGEGGMGVVYVAEQMEPVQRKVALKVVKPGMASKDVIARFEAERQALAMMDHPNIAMVLDAGATDSGQPYFVMELVQGIPITEYCDQQRLSTCERLELFQTVCRAVQHAHQKGVIHRDLKPSNVLVPRIDGQAVPKIIDFGVAKAVGQKLTEQTVYTQFAQLVGTPLYMSPEQAEFGVIEIDTRSDVYSLGVLLYELLTGDTPFDGETLKQAGFDEMRRMIREDEPLRPSARISTLAARDMSTVADRRASDPRQLAKSLEGELDWLVMKALEKDRNRRYESPNALAADIERYLRGEPVEACAPSARYRLKKFAARHKAAVTTAAILAVSLLLGIAGTSWQAWRATNALATADKNREVAEANLQLAEKQRQQALENFRRARDTVDEYLDRFEKNKVLENPDMLPLRQELVEVARKYYSQFVTEQTNEPQIQADVAKAYERLGGTLEELGKNEEAREAFQKAIMLREKIAAEGAQDEDHQNDLAASYELLAGSQEDYGAAYENLQKAIAIRRPLKKAEHRLALGQTLLAYSQLRHQHFDASDDWVHIEESLAAIETAKAVFLALVKEYPDIAEYQFSLAKFYLHLGRWDHPRSSKAESKSAYQQALHLALKLTQRFPENERYQQLLQAAYFNLEEFAKAMEINRRMAIANPDVASSQMNLAQDYRRQGHRQLEADNWPEALASFEKSSAILEKLVNRYPRQSDFKNELGSAFLALGDTYRQAEKQEEAIGAYERAISTFKKMPPAEQAGLADAYVELSHSLRDTRRIDEAIAAMRDSIRITEYLINHHPGKSRYRAVLAWEHSMLAAMMREEEKLDEALDVSRKAYRLIDALFVDGEPPEAPPDDLAFARSVLKQCHEELQRCERAKDETNAKSAANHKAHEPQRPSDE